jgi:hypothetical protein
MGTNKFSRQSPELKRQRFAWLDQVLIDRELPASAFKVAYRIGDGFNDVQHDGKAWESCKEIGNAIAMSEKTVITMVRRLHARGHLRVEWGQQGRGHPNNYWMIIKPASARVSDEIKPASTPRKPAPTQESHSIEPSDPYGVTLERDTAASAGPAPDGAPTSAAGAGDTAVPHGQELAALRAVWERKAHAVADDKPAAIKVQQQALDIALQSVSFDVILAAAKPWAEAYDPENNGRRFLYKLEDWLNTRGWKAPPPKRDTAKGANGKSHWHSRKPKSSGNAFYAEAGYERGADGVMRETKGRTH